MYNIMWSSLPVSCSWSVIFSVYSGLPTNKTDHHDITETWLKVALNIIKLNNQFKTCESSQGRIEYLRSKRVTETRKGNQEWTTQKRQWNARHRTKTNTQKAQHRKLKGEQHGPHQKLAENWSARGGEAVPASYKTPIVILTQSRCVGHNYALTSANELPYKQLRVKTNTFLFVEIVSDNKRS